jgi:ribosomal protein RSM22 (predicted rRNA methylase)
MVHQAMPQLAPKSLLDVGAGPGTASWAALAAFTSIERATLADSNPDLLSIAKSIATASTCPALRSATFTRADFHTADLPNSDLVIASYVLAEQPMEKIAAVSARLWTATQSMLLLVEPGTPQGFARIRTARAALLARGASIAAPCTHELACPIAGTDWCHFKVRLQRSRAHMHAKSAHVPFEDEPFAFVAATRETVRHSGARIVAPVQHSKFDLALQLCTDGKLQTQSIAARNKPHYKQAKKLEWGDLFTGEEKTP